MRIYVIYEDYDMEGFSSPQAVVLSNVEVDAYRQKHKWNTSITFTEFEIAEDAETLM